MGRHRTAESHRQAQLRRLAGRAGAAMVSQLLTAGGSLVLQVIAAKTLGLHGYGGFVLCLSLLTSATSLYTGYIGDGLTVLDRRDPVIRRGLVTTATLMLAGCFLLAIGLVYALGLGGAGVALVFAVMVVCWLVEETGRRLLMARLEFWKLVANDATYLVVTLLVLGALVRAGHPVTLLLVLTAMAAGAIGAIGLAALQLPRIEYAQLRWGRTGMGNVAQFGVWRSLQASLRPLQLLVARVILQQLVSLAAVGAVEAGRLVVAPIQTTINGAGSFLLSTSAEAQRRPGSAPRRMAERAAALLVVVTVVGGALAAALAHPLGRLMAGTVVSPWLVLGWVAYLALWGAGLGFVTEAVTRKLTRPVFWIRLVDSVVGVVLLAIGLWFGLSPDVTPWLLSVGAFYSFVRTSRLAIASRELEPVPHQPVLRRPAATPFTVSSSARRSSGATASSFSRTRASRSTWR